MQCGTVVVGVDNNALHLHPHLRLLLGTGQEQIGVYHIVSTRYVEGFTF